MAHYYETAGGQPRNNDLSCNCGSFRPVFNPNRPYYTKSFSGRYGWANYIMVGGIETDELEFEQEEYGASLMMNGLIFNVELRCHIAGMLCESELDYQADPTAISIAYAILYASGIETIERIFMDPRLNTTKIVDREYMAVRQKEFEEKYKEHVEYIAKTIDKTKTDCIMCREPGASPYRKPLLV